MREENQKTDEKKRNKKENFGRTNIKGQKKKDKNKTIKRDQGFHLNPFRDAFLLEIHPSH